jgi:hypothetical protein
LGHPEFGGVTIAGETGMPNTRKDGNGNHGYAAPVAWIVLLLCGYWVISEWNALPTLISSAIATIR